METPQTIIFMGKTGTGKGTQSELLAEKLGYGVFSVGDKSRAQAKEDTELGRMIADQHMKQWVSEWLASYWVTDALVREFVDTGLVFESAARKPGEAKLLHQIHHDIGRTYKVIHLVMDDEVVIERMKKRGRGDYDIDENIIRRLERYEVETTQSIAFFKDHGNVIEVDGDQTVEKVFADICAGLEMV